MAGADPLVAGRNTGRALTALDDNRIWAVVAAAVLALQTALILTHRQWIDEWQALQIAVQSPTLADLWHNLGYEGHPPAWYLLLRALAAVLPDPRAALPLASLLLALPTQAMILFAAPFRRSDRLLLALGEPVLFEFLTLSRSLTLGAALVIFAVATWRHRVWPWLAIALLPAVEALFGVIAIGLIGLRWRERRIEAPLLALWLAVSLVSAWSVRAPPDLVPALRPGGLILGGATWLFNLGAVGFPLQWGPHGPEWNRPAPPLPDLAGAAALLALIVHECRRQREAALAMVLLVGATLVLGVKIYPLSVRHLMLIALLLVALVWRRAALGGAGPGAAMRAWLAVSALCGLFTAGVALTRPFDTAPETAAMIRRLGLADKAWVAFPHSAGQSVAALSGMTFERFDASCAEDFIRWSMPHEYAHHDAATLFALLQQKLRARGTFYLLSSADLPDKPDLLHPLGTVAPGYDGQVYMLYRVGDGARAARRAETMCAGPWQPLNRR